MSAVLDTILTDAAAGRGPDAVLLMRLLSEASTEGAARDALVRAIHAAEPAGRSRLERLRSLWTAHPQAWATVRSVLDGVSHEARDGHPDEALRAWSSVFDRLATAAPEAGVALYSFGDPTLLATATDEIVALMERLDLLGWQRHALDLGCGIGRLAAALAPRMSSVLGIDLSAGMVAEAERRCASFANVRVLQGSGRDLAVVADRSLDVVLAADVFPYLVQAGGDLPARHVADFARILRPGGAALILNYSYRGDLQADARDLEALAAAAGLTVERNGTRDLSIWDAATFLLRQAERVSR